MANLLEMMNKEIGKRAPSQSAKIFVTRAALDRLKEIKPDLSESRVVIMDDK